MSTACTVICTKLIIIQVTIFVLTILRTVMVLHSEVTSIEADHVNTMVIHRWEQGDNCDRKFASYAVIATIHTITTQIIVIHHQ